MLLRATALSKTEVQMPNGQNKENAGIKVESLIIGIGTEQVVLDCELAIQQETEDKTGRLWIETGKGKRTGSSAGKFAVDISIFKDVIPLIKSGVLGFNSNQQHRTLDRLKRMYPWAAGHSGLKYWLAPIYDHHIRKSEREKMRRAEKKAKNGDA
jgi:hypothetical protein